jgi:hypothetical protein
MSALEKGHFQFFVGKLPPCLPWEASPAQLTAPKQFEVSSKASQAYYLLLAGSLACLGPESEERVAAAAAV